MLYINNGDKKEKKSMKIEMGESLINSWLKHVKKCQLSQMNFKISPEWEISNELIDKYQNIMDKSDDYFNSPFKQVKNIKSLLKQAEIDNIGVNFKKNYLYAVDVAFHEQGLNYAKKNYSTEDNITKKILRTIFISKIYFNDIEHQNVIFASPKVNPTTDSRLRTRFNEIEQFLLENEISVKIDLISNNDFLTKIITPLLNKSSSISDTSELFLRSIQLNNLFSGNSNTHRNIVTENQEVKERIGVFAKRTFTKILNESLLSEELILKLHDREYSKEKFDMNYSILNNFSNDSVNTKRYYKHSINNEVYLTNDWYSRHWGPLNNWLLEQGLNDFLS